MSNEIEISLQVVDEHGKPIPYVTVWGYVLPRSTSLAINSDDLWRLTTNYQSSFEFSTYFNRPIDSLFVYPMADGNGNLNFKIVYDENVEGKGAKRPEHMQLGFTAMKKGYLPNRLDFAVTDESHLDGKLILKPDPTQAQEQQPYLQEFARLRYELSNYRDFANISVETSERIERIRKELEMTAQQALSASDKPAAARIYARLRNLPSITFVNGQPAGFSQQEPSSDQSMAYLKKAYSLDQSNPYIAVSYLLDEQNQSFRSGEDSSGRYKKYDRKMATSEQQRDFADFLISLKKLMQAHKNEIWPTYRELYARWYGSSNDPHERERVLPLLEELYRDEPKFQDKEMLFWMPPK